MLVINKATITGDNSGYAAQVTWDSPIGEVTLNLPDRVALDMGAAISTLLEQYLPFAMVNYHVESPPSSDDDDDIPF